MADDQPPRVKRGVDEYASGANQAYTALSYLIGGIVVWGLVGWLVDRWLHLNGIGIAIGVVLGVVGGVWLVVLRMTGSGGKR